MDSDNTEYLNKKSTPDNNQHFIYQLERDQFKVVKNASTIIKRTMRDSKNQGLILEIKEYFKEL